jgi:glycosyltransferase involved in cell wall biosynthesis
VVSSVLKEDCRDSVVSVRRTVSVVVPVFNRVDTIAIAVLSALDQTIRPSEILVIDDCSTDGSAAAVESLNSPLVRVIRRESNGGPSIARNEGIALASGTFIAFLDSDDLWMPRKLEEQLATREAVGEPCLVCCGFRTFGLERRSREVIHDYTNGVATVRDLLRPAGTPLSASIMMMDAAVAERYNFSEMPALEDLDLAVRLAKAGVPVVSCPSVLVEKRADRGRIRAYNAETAITGRLALLEAHYDYLGDAPRLWDAQLAALSISAMEAGLPGETVRAILLHSRWPPSRLIARAMSTGGRFSVNQRAMRLVLAGLVRLG